MLQAIYFALHFAMIFLGVVLAIHFDFWLGFAIATTFTIKWFFMFPQVEGRRRATLIGVMDQSVIKNILLTECEVLRALRF